MQSKLDLQLKNVTRVTFRKVIETIFWICA